MNSNSIQTTELSTSISEYVATIAAEAQQAAQLLSSAPTSKKNLALTKAVELLDANRTKIVEVNKHDMDNAEKNKLAAALLDRLELNDERVDGMIASLNKVASLDDPIGEINSMKYMPSGIRVGRMRVPLGVVGIIYESRPNVTVEAASLSLKSGNACILRGGSEAINSSLFLTSLMRQALEAAGLAAGAIIQVQSADRAIVGELIGSTEYLDVLIPRGGKGLIERISQESKVNVIKHLDGNCHVYIDKEAESQMALDIAINAKTRRYGVCNAMETLLVHKDRAAELLPQLAQGYMKHEVELRCCDKTMKILKDVKACDCKPAIEEDWYEEYLAPILAIKVVNDFQQATEHINKYGSHHTDAIVTENKSSGEDFIKQIDSSSVMWNASTGFADGFEYGLGAEVGISTDKFHARGPVGLEGLTCQKYVVLGDGNTRP